MQTESDVDNTPLTIATSKHFFVYNLESDFAAGGDDPQARLKINVNVTDADLRQTYLRIFEKTTSPHFTKSPARSVMCSYNAINGIPACAHPMLQEYLRDELAFPGFIVSDEGAIQWMGEGYHEYTSSDAESAKVGLETGTDLCLGVGEYNSFDDSSVEHETLEKAFTNLFTARIELGMLDPFDSVSWSDLSAENAVDTAESRALARALAGESLVLLKNENNVLPLKTTTKKVALLGPNANRTETLLSNYAGCKANPNDQTIDPSCTLVNPLDGLKAMAMKDGFEVTYEQGVDIDTKRTDGINAAVKLASEADVAVIVVGLITCQETGDQCQEAEALDRTSITLPGLQEALVEQVVNTGTPAVVVVMSGGTVSVPSLAKSDSVGAIIQSFYGGEELGSALADMLFGKINPSGRLPATIFEKLEDLPADHLSMEMLDAPGRTGRYFKGEPLYAFGFGLSYSEREYSGLDVSWSDDNQSNLKISVSVVQTAGPDSDEVVQCYTSYRGDYGISVPVRNLVAFKRVPIKTNVPTDLVFNVAAKDLELMSKDGEMKILQGEYGLSCGGAAPGSQGLYVSRKLSVVEATFEAK